MASAKGLTRQPRWAKRQSLICTDQDAQSATCGRLHTLDVTARNGPPPAIQTNPHAHQSARVVTTARARRLLLVDLRRRCRWLRRKSGSPRSLRAPRPRYAPGWRSIRPQQSPLDTAEPVVRERRYRTRGMGRVARPLGLGLDAAMVLMVRHRTLSGVCLVAASLALAAVET